MLFLLVCPRRVSRFGAGDVAGDSSTYCLPHSMPTSAENTDVRDIRKTGINPDFWYPVARSKAVKPGKALPVSFAGTPIALVRSTQGKLFAVEDRCAHRQVPLHLGVVEGECIKCAYHGWKYDATGRCVSVPYL